LRTPLNAIIGYSELLQEAAYEVTPAELITDSEKIRTAGSHLLHLINGVLDISKIEAGRMEMQLSAFEVAGLVQNVASTVERLVERNGNRFEVQLAPDLGEMRADEVKLRQVLLNLLSNAAKFTSEGLVRLSVWREVGPEPVFEPEVKPGFGWAGSNSWIVFQVCDSGIGMDAEQLSRLFTAFSQVHEARSGEYGGTGLGLVISRQFCQMMGGDIIVDSKVGEGSTFTARVPELVERRRGGERRGLEEQ
jgi:signal transduction histidine kinase